MATYNGSEFLVEQLLSILEQLREFDELVIVDDCSTDQTVELVRSVVDSRIVLRQNQRNVGVNGSFALAISLATGDVIFLSDQDDVWIPGRLQLMLQKFSSDAVEVVATNYKLIDQNGSPLGAPNHKELTEKNDDSALVNIANTFLGRMNYYGCAMAFRSSLRAAILPLPKRLECHDIWICLIGNIRRSTIHISEPTLLHRIHGRNASVISRSLSVRIMSRSLLLLHFVLALARSLRSVNLRKLKH